MSNKLYNEKFLKLFLKIACKVKNYLLYYNHEAGHMLKVLKDKCMIKFREKKVANLQMVTRNEITEEFVQEHVGEKIKELSSLYRKGEYVSFYMIINKITGDTVTLAMSWSRLRDAVDHTETNRKLFTSRPETIYVYGTGVIESDGVSIFDIDALETYSN